VEITSDFTGYFGEAARFWRNRQSNMAYFARGWIGTARKANLLVGGGEKSYSQKLRNFGEKIYMNK